MVEVVVAKIVNVALFEKVVVVAVLFEVMFFMCMVEYCLCY